MPLDDSSFRFAPPSFCSPLGFSVCAKRSRNLSDTGDQSADMRVSSERHPSSFKFGPGCHVYQSDDVLSLSSQDGIARDAFASSCGSVRYMDQRSQSVSLPFTGVPRNILMMNLFLPA
jgi:hypothetical protein